MKSAYDLALERLEQQGIDKPRDESFTAETREQIAELRNQAEAKLAEFVKTYEKSAPKLATWAEQNIPEGLTVFSFP